MSAIRKSLITGGEPEERYPVPKVDDFRDEDDPRFVRDFIKGTDIRPIAQALIKERKCFEKIRFTDIDYAWKREGGRSGGKPVLGKCIKLSGTAKYYAGGPEFLIWLSADWMLALTLTRFQVEAIIFHELKHATTKINDLGEKVPSILPHDWEGFYDEIRYYGPYLEDIKYIGKAFQRNLFSSVEEVEGDDSPLGFDSIEISNRTLEGDTSLGIIQPGMFSQNPVVGLDPAGGKDKSIVTMTDEQFHQAANGGGGAEGDQARSLLTGLISNALQKEREEETNAEDGK